MRANTRYVLLVDDEQNILNALRRELHGWAAERSLGILTAISARKGMELLRARGEDVIIVVSDLRMPETLGSDFLLEARKAYPDIVSILLTGYSETSEVIKAVQAGIFSYMLKPWDSAYLIAEITKAYDYGELRRQSESRKRALEEELRWAGEMQKAILKPMLPRTEGLEFRASYRPAPGLYCGGDYYDVIFLTRDRYLLLVGDVIASGVKAAFVTGILKATIFPEYVHTQSGRSLSPAAFLSWLNERMNFEFRSVSSMTISFFAGILDRQAMTFRYANAGHNHPFVAGGGKARELLVSGSAIGFANSVAYAEQSVEVAPGDVIVLYTNGLIASACEGGATVKLGPTLERIEYGNDYHRRILESSLADAGAQDFADDVTILTARIL